MKTFCQKWLGVMLLFVICACWVGAIGLAIAAGDHPHLSAWLETLPGKLTVIGLVLSGGGVAFIGQKIGAVDFCPY